MPRLRTKALVKANLDLWLNNIFLKDGFFTTVSVGETDVYGRDLSNLISTSDEDFPDDMVWQSAFKEWVYESGVVPNYPIAAPIVASGVTVNGTFYPKDPSSPGYNSAYGHNIDYKNGRVIFNSPRLSTDVVQAEFSYKEITIDYAARFENEEMEFNIETSYKDNPMQTGVLIYPQKNSRTLPMVLISITSENSSPYELGVAPATRVVNGTLHVWTRDDYMRDQIEDIILENERSVLLGIDFNDAPHPLTYLNDKNPDFTNYDSMANLNSSYLWHRIYLDEITSTLINPYYNIERTNMNFTARVYPNF